MNDQVATYLAATKLSRHAIFTDIPSFDLPVEPGAFKVRIRDRWTWSDLSYDAFGNQRPVHPNFYQLGRELIESSERTVAEYVLAMSNRPALKLPLPKDGKHISHRNARRLRRR